MKTKHLVILLISSLFLFSHAQAAVILPPGHTWEYTFTDPTGDATWNTTTGGWSTGAAPFGNQGGSGDFSYNTYWAADGRDGYDLWVRTAINLTLYDLSTVSWDLGVDNGFSLFANGNSVASANAEGYTWRWEYGDDFVDSHLSQGVTVIAVALEDHGGATAFDMQITGDLRDSNSVPEPATMLLLGTGLIGLAGLRRRFKK